MIKGLPEKIKELRQKYGLSQRDVANRLGISPSIISGYETGERTPSVENIIALSSLYRCSTDYLLGRDNDMTISPINIDGLSHRQVQLLSELIDYIRKE